MLPDRSRAMVPILPCLVCGHQAASQLILIVSSTGRSHVLLMLGGLVVVVAVSMCLISLGIWPISYTICSTYGWVSSITNLHLDFQITQHMIMFLFHSCCLAPLLLLLVIIERDSQSSTDCCPTSSMSLQVSRSHTCCTYGQPKSMCSRISLTLEDVHRVDSNTPLLRKATLVSSVFVASFHMCALTFGQTFSF